VAARGSREAGRDRALVPQDLGAHFGREPVVQTPAMRGDRDGASVAIARDAVVLAQGAELPGLLVQARPEHACRREERLLDGDAAAERVTHDHAQRPLARHHRDLCDFEGTSRRLDPVAQRTVQVDVDRGRQGGLAGQRLEWKSDEPRLQAEIRAPLHAAQERGTAETSGRRGEVADAQRGHRIREVPAQGAHEAQRTLLARARKRVLAREQAEPAERPESQLRAVARLDRRLLQQEIVVDECTGARNLRPRREARPERMFGGDERCGLGNEVQLRARCVELRLDPRHRIEAQVALTRIRDQPGFVDQQPPPARVLGGDQQPAVRRDAHDAAGIRDHAVDAHLEDALVQCSGARRRADARGQQDGSRRATGPCRRASHGPLPCRIRLRAGGSRGSRR
jgi:hypothetical protein